jgi:peptidoglycan/xylan/chitin deacetylase (PgdA/CDA1 family)
MGRNTGSDLRIMAGIAPVKGGEPGRRHVRMRRVALLAAILAAAATASALNGGRSVTPASGAAMRVHTVKAPFAAPLLADDPVSSPPPLPVHLSPGKSLMVPILMYHYIRVNPVATDKVGFGLSVTPDAFAAQMTYLHDCGAHTVTLLQVMSALGGGPPLPTRPVVLTFDDGHDDFATQAVPIMRDYGFVGTDFVVPGFMGHTSYMTQQQVRQVDALGMVVGAHTVHHVALAHATASVAKAEIDGSKQLLEQLLGHPVLDFAYPYGSYSPQVGQLVQAAGFRDAVTTYSGDTEYSALPYVLDRVRVDGGESLATFAAQALLPPPPARWTAPPAARFLSSPPLPSPTPLAALIQELGRI